MDAPQAGTIVRKSGGLIGYGKNSLLEEKFPKIIVSHNAVEKAGSELALKGKISKKTEKTASQDIIPIPLFSILKNFVWFKKKAVERLNSQNI
jgi:hypothetical protein